MNKNEYLLSFLIPTYNGEKTLGKLVREIFSVFQKYQIEVVIVNDFSPDNTDNVCKNLIEEFPKKITYIKLSKNFGEHNAVMAGLRNCEGQHVIIMDDDYQNLPSEALKLAEYSLKNNYDVVFTKYKTKEDSFLRNLMSKIANFSADKLINKPKNLYLSSFKFLNKNIVDEIVKYKGPFPYIDGLILTKTHNIGSCDVIHAPRISGKSNYSLLKLGKHFSNLIFNFSTKPIHLFSVFGVIILFICLLFIIITVIEK